MTKIMKLKKTFAFSLIELMVVVVIIGILGTIAIPSYNKYTANAKISEAYAIMDNIGKAQISYYGEHDEFVDVAPSPLGLDKPMTFTDNDGWSEIGFPIALGSNLNFTFRSRTGKTDASGTELAGSLTHPTQFFTNVSNNTILSNRYYTPVSLCNPALATPSSLGVTPVASYNWTVISAVGDLNANRDTSCTAVARILEASGATEGKPAYMGGFIVLNAGD